MVKVVFLESMFALWKKSGFLYDRDFFVQNEWDYERTVIATDLRAMRKRNIIVERATCCARASKVDIYTAVEGKQKIF